MDVVLFPGRVSMDKGVRVTVPELLLIPDQKVVPRLALSNVKVFGGLPSAPS